MRKSAREVSLSIGRTRALGTGVDTDYDKERERASEVEVRLEFDYVPGMNGSGNWSYRNNCESSHIIPPFQCTSYRIAMSLCQLHHILCIYYIR